MSKAITRRMVSDQSRDGSTPSTIRRRGTQCAGQPDGVVLGNVVRVTVRGQTADDRGTDVVGAQPGDDVDILSSVLDGDTLFHGVVLPVDGLVKGGVARRDIARVGGQAVDA